MKNELPKPWERQPNESFQAFEAFAVYRDMGTERSYPKTSQKLSKNLTSIKQWGVKNNWISRVKAWEDEQDRLIRESLTKGIAHMRKTHADLASAMLVKAAKALRDLPTDEMTPKDIATMVDVGAKLERLSRGEATEKTENKTEIGGGIVKSCSPFSAV